MNRSLIIKVNNEAQEVNKENKEKTPKWEHPFKSMGAFLDFIGWRHISQKFKTSIDPKTGKRVPQTFFIWIIGIYVALFSVASQRYENRIDIIENRVNAIFLQLKSPFYKNAFRQIARVQNMKCPIKPEIWNPFSVILFPFQIDTYSEAVELLIEAVETWKDSLREVNLSNANLSGANLSNANLNGANLSNADLSGANLSVANLNSANLSSSNLSITDLNGTDLSFADLSYAFLSEANLSGADLIGTNLFCAYLRGANLSVAYLGYSDLIGAYLRGADLNDADFSYAFLSEANLRGADLNGADLRGTNLRGANLLLAKNLTIEQLSKVAILKEALLDSTIEKQFKELYPDKWEELRKK